MFTKANSASETVAQLRNRFSLYGFHPVYACATVSLAELASANIVGYTSTSITGVDSSNEVKWYQLGIQFKGVSESSDQIKLADAISLSGVVATSNWRNRSTGPMLQFYNGTSYDMYYYVSSSVSGLEEDAWVNGMKEDASAAIDALISYYNQVESEIHPVFDVYKFIQAMKRCRMAAHWARVALPLGARVVSVVPLMMPVDTAQPKASEANLEMALRSL
jgi:hypothetical protein